MPHHTVCLYMRESLNSTIPEHWIVHGGFLGLQPRSRDIMPCDQIYRSYISNIGELKMKIRETVGNTSDGIRLNFWSEFEH